MSHTSGWIAAAIIPCLGAVLATGAAEPTVALESPQPESGSAAAAQASPGDEAAGIYCKLSTQALRERLGELRADFLSAVVAVDELENGYRFWFPKSADRLRRLADFVAFESECCPFLDFAMTLESEADAVALSLSGREGTKQALDSMVEAADFDLAAALRARR